MNRPRSHGRTLFIIALSMGCAFATTRVMAASTLNFSTLIPVTEYYNLQTRHYFMTQDAQEAAGIDAGAAGPGWIRTGLSFWAYTNAPCSTAYCGKPVSRFYAPGPNSHFFTMDEAEAAGLKQPGTGWIFEGDAFAAAPVDSAGGCGAPTIPVYRLYNNRFAQNDSNHRFVTRADQRARLLAQGWVDEGVGFCAWGALEVAIKSFAFVPSLEGNVLPSSECEDETKRLGSCVAVNNLPVPSQRFGYEGAIDYFTSVTGTSALEVYAPPRPPLQPVNFGEVRDGVFVQYERPSTLGIHVDSRSRGASIYSSVNPLYQFKTTVDPGAADARVFPFVRAYESDAQISVKFDLRVRSIALRGADSHAYGHPTLEFIDQRSGHHLYMTALTYGTIAFTDFVAQDVGTGKVIVGTTLRWDSSYLWNIGMLGFRTAPAFTSQSFQGDGGHFEFRVHRESFGRVLQSARAVDAALSSEPADYLLDNFHFNNEVVGDGGIGMNIANFALEIVRR